MNPRAFAVGATAFLVVAGLTACGGDHGAGTSGHATSTPAASTSAAASAITTTSNPYGAPPIDPPAPNEAVLTVTGGSAPLSLTMDQLDALGQTTVTVDEPFVKKRQTFSGVLLAAVLAKAGVSDNATIDTVALNAYHYTSPVHAMVASDALIATRRDNVPIPYDQGGPVRMVFPDGTALASVLDAWNWSVASINVVSPNSGSS
ncbi:Oxidoreductase molybdopterin binding [uncultured Mycobacterium sp.]|uniref:Oxidoreductase molybdopterin binding n=1 Tax=uncultured Mycobacterium sp. TaxID=171292 RepID=A0A1Y5PM32_9MYCO|nr:Oxidoreductase molybdopterin binding [uncultured Mycobacterium sp.]